MSYIGGIKNCQWVRVSTDAERELVLTEVQHDLDRHADEFDRSVAYRLALRTRVLDWLRARAL